MDAAQLERIRQQMTKEAGFFGAIGKGFTAVGKGMTLPFRAASSGLANRAARNQALRLARIANPRPIAAAAAPAIAAAPVSYGDIGHGILGAAGIAGTGAAYGGASYGGFAPHQWAGQHIENAKGPMSEISDPYERYGKLGEQYKTMMNPIHQAISDAQGRNDFDTATELRQRLASGKTDFSDKMSPFWRRWTGTATKDQKYYDDLQEKMQQSGGTSTRTGAVFNPIGNFFSPWNKSFDSDAYRTGMQGAQGEAFKRYQSAGGEPEKLRNQLDQLKEMRNNSFMAPPERASLEKQITAMKARLSDPKAAGGPMDIRKQMMRSGMADPELLGPGGAPNMRTPEPGAGRWGGGTRPAGYGAGNLNLADMSYDPTMSGNASRDVAALRARYNSGLYAGQEQG